MENSITPPNDTSCPHLGKLVNYTIYQHRIKKKDIAKFLEMNPYSISAIIKKPSFHLDLLWGICRFTNINFIAQLGERLGIEYQTQKEKELLNQLAQKDEEIKNLTTQLGVYKEIVKSKV
jgi:hypothetical protein